jgi:hypothetical protein
MDGAWLFGIAVLLFMIVVGGCYWGYVFWPAIKGRNKLTALPDIRPGLLQIPIAFTLAMAAIGFKDFLYLTLFPPLTLWLFIPRLYKYSEFSLPIVITSGLIATLIFFAFRQIFSTLNYWAWSAATLTFTLTFFIVADVQTKRLQAFAIQDKHFDCVVMKSFWESFNMDKEHPLTVLNTAGMKDNKIYGWSFLTVDFYELPETVAIGAVC